MAVRNPFAAALAADFRANGIFRNTATEDSPRARPARDEQGRLYDGPVCFYCNNVTDLLGYTDTGNAFRAASPTGDSVVGFLEKSSNDTVLALLDSLNA